MASHKPGVSPCGLYSIRASGACCSLLGSAYKYSLSQQFPGRGSLLSRGQSRAAQGEVRKVRDSWRAERREAGQDALNSKLDAEGPGQGGSRLLPRAGQGKAKPSGRPSHLRGGNGASMAAQQWGQAGLAGCSVESSHLLQRQGAPGVLSIVRCDPCFLKLVARLWEMRVMCINAPG